MVENSEIENFARWLTIGFSTKNVMVVTFSSKFSAMSHFEIDKPKNFIKIFTYYLYWYLSELPLIMGFLIITNI